MTDWPRFAEKYRMAVTSALESHFDRGTSGLEVELNILDERLRPVTRIGYGPEARSFADYLVDELAPPFVASRMQREVFHWMTEFATRPYYAPEGAALEAKVLEGVLADVLDKASLSAGGRFAALHGNLLYPVVPDEGSIPDGWSLGKRRYLAKCVALFGARLATAGIHTNHSLPEPLLSWDFFHLPHGEREGRTLADYRSEAMIRITRVLRPYCPLFIAVSGSTPLRAELVDGDSALVLTEEDSNRLLTFPNPETLDVPHLYASHADYLRISYDLVRRGVRFGGNNWTPVRARSDVDPVNRILSTTSEQLRELYRKGLYAHDVHATLGAAERALLVDNLCALVDLPMSRVEVRTDEGGDSLDLAIAKVAFKELLALRTYADDAFGAGYAYDEADVARARRNEDEAARRGPRRRCRAPVHGRACERARVARRHPRGARAARRRRSATLSTSSRSPRWPPAPPTPPARCEPGWRRVWPAPGARRRGCRSCPTTSCASGSTSARGRSPPTWSTPPAARARSATRPPSSTSCSRRSRA